MHFSASERLPDHGFVDADERLHQPPAALPERWQENMFFVAWDLEAGHGVLIHTKRWPARADHEAHVVVFVDGVPSSAVLHRPTGTTLHMNEEIPELSAEVEVPWSRWRIQAELDATEGFGPYGFLAHRPVGPTKTVVDITLESELQPADFNVALASWADEQAERSGPHNSAQQHYEHGGRWHGSLRIGNRTVQAKGVYVRDHSWGERVESNFDSGVFWTASSLDDGRLFCNAIGFPSAAGTLGTGIIVTSDGAFSTRNVDATFTPEPGLTSYDTSRISYGFAEPVILDGCTTVHVPKYLPGSGDRRYDNNAISHVRIGEATGMGCLEWAAVLDADRAATLDALLDDTPV
ncbi:hypothetical protein [Ilumatobacter sp.]|uniref:hypothetical protein n=1 Tax=Ilumatobacter sp. TaxID=1967498 RepID=UPI003C5EA9BC